MKPPRPPITSKIRRTSAQSYGSRQAWSELCAKVKARDGYKCVKCKATTSLTVDHIVPVAQGGSSVMANLWTLCVDCHCKRPRHAKVAKLLKAGASYRKKRTNKCPRY